MRGSGWLAMSGAALAAFAVGCAGGGNDGAGAYGSNESALTGSTFESKDGNLIVDTSGNEDWANAPNLVTKTDLTNSSSDDAEGQGSKEDIPVPTIVQGSIPPNKSDLSRFYVANEHVSGKDFLYIAWERTNTLGTANMDFEFNQSTVLSSNGVTPVRTAGDILITFDFAQGGGTVNLGLLRWMTSGSASSCFASSKLPCWGNRQDLTKLGFAEGAVNSGTVTDPISGASLPANTFGEAAVNLTDSGVLPVGECVSFGRAQLHSRSSSSFTAEIKDIISPVPVNINNCQPTTIKLQKVDTRSCTGTGDQRVCTGFLGGATLALYKDANGDQILEDGTDTLVGTCTSSATDGVGTCSFNVTQDGFYIGHETTPPAGFSAAPDKGVAVSITQTAQTITLVFEDTPLPGAVSIQKQDDAGNPVSGAVFTVFADASPLGCPAGAEDTSAGTCTTDSTGACSVSNLPPGSYLVVETSTPAGYFTANPSCKAVTIGVAAGGDTQPVSFTNPRKFHAITFVCKSADNSLAPSSIALDGGSTQTSISSADLTALGLTAAQQAALCGLTKGRVGDIAAGTSSHTYDLTIQ